MISIPTKVRYGIRLMLDLAIHYGEGPIPLSDTAKREQLPEKYLGNITTYFRAAGLVKSARGSHGGYFIAKPPSQISLNDIIRVLEGPVCLVECVDNPSSCKFAPACVPREFWCKISDMLRQFLKSTTLKDMVEKGRNEAKIMVRDL